MSAQPEAGLPPVERLVQVSTLVPAEALGGGNGRIFRPMLHQRFGETAWGALPAHGDRTLPSRAWTSPVLAANRGDG